MQKFVSCRHASLGCGLRVRKQYRERHADCCAFKILHELKLKRRQQQQQQLLLQGAPSGAVSSAPAGEGSTEGAAAATEGAAQACSSAEAAAAAGAAAADASSAAAAAVQASSAGAPAATEAPAATAAAAEATAADAGSKMSDDCADLCLALQWSSQQQVLPNELLLLRLQEFLPNVAAITEGRFPGEFHVVLRQQVHTRTAAAVANAAVPAAGTAVSDGTTVVAARCSGFSACVGFGCCCCCCSLDGLRQPSAASIALLVSAAAASCFVALMSPQRALAPRLPLISRGYL